MKLLRFLESYISCEEIWRCPIMVEIPGKRNQALYFTKREYHCILCTIGSIRYPTQSTLPAPTVTVVNLQ